MPQRMQVGAKNESVEQKWEGLCPKASLRVFPNPWESDSPGGGSRKSASPNITEPPSFGFLDQVPSGRKWLSSNFLEDEMMIETLILRRRSPGENSESVFPNITELLLSLVKCELCGKDLFHFEEDCKDKWNGDCRDSDSEEKWDSEHWKKLFSQTKWWKRIRKSKAVFLRLSLTKWGVGGNFSSFFERL